jgi:transposase
MMGRQDRDQRQLFYEFSLDEMIPTDHLLRRINVFATAAPADLHEQLRAFYSDIGRPSVDPELMIRMLLVGYCYGIRHERRLCQEVALHLAYRWFCKLDLDDKIPHHSTFSVNRLGRFRESEILRHIFERVVTQCMAAGLVKGEGFAVDASVITAKRRTSWTAKLGRRTAIRSPRRRGRQPRRNANAERLPRPKFGSPQDRVFSARSLSPIWQLRLLLNAIGPRPHCHAKPT